MQSKDSRSPAHPEPARQHVASPGALVGIAVAVIVTLVLIFPGRGLLTSTTTGAGSSTYGRTTGAPGGGPTGAPGGTSTTTSAKPPDTVGLIYLENMAKKEPGNPELRFTLAQKQVELGKIAEGRAALEPLYNSPDPAVRQRARLADFKLQMQQMQALPTGSRERAKEVERLRQELVAMSQYEWEVAGLLDLADVANQLQARKLRAELYARTVRSDNKVSKPWLDDAAKKVLADGEYLTAAEMYFTAMERAASIDEKRGYFRQAIGAYQAGNMPREALLAAEVRLGSLGPADDDMLHFMIRLARAANDTQRAQLYAKRLLRMSHEGIFLRSLKAAASFIVPSAHAADAGSKPQPPLGMRAYDRENYELAYEVFLANRNLQDAYRVARSAVQQVPGDMRWRERLAQVSEWSGRSGEALEQWLYIARRTGSANAWQAVLRIAPGAADDELMLEAMRYQSSKVALTDAQLRAIGAAYERVGRPREGIEFLEQEYKRRPRPGIQESLASLYERSGDVANATRIYRELVQRDATTERVTTLASLLMAQGEFREAYDLLERQRPKVPAEDAEYLRLLGDLALKLRDQSAAQVQYERLVAHPNANLDDYVRLVNLLAPRQPESAARLAEAAYEKFNSQEMLLTALGIHSQRRDFGTLRRLFAGMSPEMERSLSENAGFLLLRADYRAASGSPQLALADYREALRLDPNNRFARMGLMYFLIERRDVAALRRELPMAVKLSETDADFNAVVGATYLAIDDPQRALPYFGAAVKRNPDDYLALLNYADVLDRNIQPDFAWRVRRHAWIQIREQVQKTPKPPLELIQAQARLVSQFYPGDQGLALMRHLLREDNTAGTISDDPLRKPLDAATRELVLAWTVSTEQPFATKVWMWTQYARGLTAPKWAEVLTALALSDLETAQRALEQSADAIPRYDRHEAARRTQQYRLAQDIAFTELEKYPYDDEMHLRLTQSTFDMVSHSEAGYSTFTRGPVRGHELKGEVAVWLSPRLRLSMDVSDITQGLSNTAGIAYIPGKDRVYGVTALWRHPIGETRFGIFHREALTETTGFTLVHQYPLGTRVGSRVGIAYNERTLETAALAAGAVRDRAHVDLQYTLSKREYIIGQLFANRYYTQDERTHIGSSHGFNWEAGHRFRTEYPDFHVRAAGSINHFSRSGTGDASTAILTPDGSVPGASFFLPGSFSVYGLYTGFGTYYQNNYTRALRPFVDVGVNRNTVTGGGYTALVGISGSVAGADKLTLYAQTGRGGSGVDERSREVGLKYMYLFDNF